MRTSMLLTAAAAAVVGFTFALSQPSASGHCQIPCGIYDDPMRITMLREDAATIRKATVSMGSELNKTQGGILALNQVVRWVNVKEQTATNIQRTISDYFLTQRVKAVEASDADYGAYLAQLEKMHAILTAAMKCKQTADLDAVNTLDAAIEAIAPAYVHEHDH